jgi:hypothetical protein
MVTRNRKPPRAVFHGTPNIKAEDFKDSEQLKLLLNKEIPIAIYDAILRKKKSASIFEINNSSNFLDINKDQWASSLEWCLSYYIELEDYAECTKIQSTIDKLRK